LSNPQLIPADEDFAVEELADFADINVVGYGAALGVLTRQRVVEHDEWAVDNGRTRIVVSPGPLMREQGRHVGRMVIVQLGHEYTGDVGEANAGLNEPPRVP
jgi:hypothetical protein